MSTDLTRREDRIGFACAAGAAILYGSAYPATAVALRSFTPIGVAALACTIALPFVIAFGWLGWLPRPAYRGLGDPARLIRLTILALLGGLLFIAAVNSAVALSGPTVTGFVAPLYAIAAAVLAVPLLGEPIRPRTIVAFAVALVGTALLAGAAPQVGSLAGVVLALAAAVSFGLYMVLARRWSERYALDGTLLTVANLIGRGPVLLAVELVRSPSTLIPADPDPAAVAAVLVIAFGASSTANLLLIASVRRVPAARSSAALLLTPVTSAILGVMVLDDTLAPIQVIGGILTVIGIGIGAGALSARTRWFAGA